METISSFDAKAIERFNQNKIALLEWIFMLLYSILYNVILTFNWKAEE